MEGIGLQTIGGMQAPSNQGWNNGSSLKVSACAAVAFGIFSLLAISGSILSAVFISNIKKKIITVSCLGVISVALVIITAVGIKLSIFFKQKRSKNIAVFGRDGLSLAEKKHLIEFMLQGLIKILSTRQEEIMTQGVRIENQFFASLAAAMYCLENVQENDGRIEEIKGIIDQFISKWAEEADQEVESLKVLLREGGPLYLAFNKKIQEYVQTEEYVQNVQRYGQRYGQLVLQERIAIFVRPFAEFMQRRDVGVFLGCYATFAPKVIEMLEAEGNRDTRMVDVFIEQIRNFYNGGSEMSLEVSEGDDKCPQLEIIRDDIHAPVASDAEYEDIPETYEQDEVLAKYTCMITQGAIRYPVTLKLRDAKGTIHEYTYERKAIIKLFENATRVRDPLSRKTVTIEDYCEDIQKREIIEARLETLQS